MVICLVASNYELSANHTDEGGFFTETLLEAIELDSKQIIHHIDLNQLMIQEFYLREGFLNGQVVPHRGIFLLFNISRISVDSQEIEPRPPNSNSKDPSLKSTYCV